IVEQLLNRVNFDLPESLVAGETKSVVYSIVSENQRRGIPKEIIDQEKDKIYASANSAAKDRVKLHFLFHKIADKEGIRVTDPELSARILLLAQANNMAPDKFLKELKERSGLGEVMESILHEKVVDFLHDKARIEDVLAQA